MNKQRFYLVQVVTGLRKNINGSYYIVVRAAGDGGTGVLYAPTPKEDIVKAQQWADSLDRVLTLSYAGGFFQLEDSTLARQYVELGLGEYSPNLPEWEEEEEMTETVVEVTNGGQQPA